jgi:hypothetical protein
VAFSCSHLRLLQVVAGRVDKADALATVAEFYGIDPDRVLAIGDAPNDLGMIRWAGLGVAMQNAWDEVRAAAHFIVPSNEHAGVAHAFRKYVLRR